MVRSSLLLFPLRSGLVAWALALRFSFTCCVAGYCLVALYDWRPRDMLCSWQHPAIMLPAGAVIWQIFGPVHCSSEAFFECSLGSVSASYVSKLLTSQCSWQSASHPTSPFVLERGVPQVGQNFDFSNFACSSHTLLLSWTKYVCWFKKSEDSNFRLK